MSVEVRQAGESDANLLSLLNRDVQALHAGALPERFKPPGPDTFPPEEVRRILLEPRNLIFVAEIDGTPAGYAWAEFVHVAESPLRRAWDEVHLHHISVHPDFRRRGVAAALLDRVKESGRAQGIHLVTLQAWFFNENTRAFFRRQGFVPYMERLWLK